MPSVKLHVKKGDMVTVIAGKERGKSGKVLRVLPKKQRVIIEKINMLKKHLKKRAQGQGGGIIEIEGGIHVSNVMLNCPSCKKPTRIGKKRLEDGRGVRICKKCEEIIDR
jgi:large subunit ribosomal protein L24